MSLTPEYLHELADIADPDELWRLNPFDQSNLEPVLRRRLDSGVALRRYAAHLRRLRDLLGTGKSLVTTPLTSGSTATMSIVAPPNHKRLLRHHLPKIEGSA